jgi:hypothetical protein
MPVKDALAAARCDSVLCVRHNVLVPGRLTTIESAWCRSNSLTDHFSNFGVKLRSAEPIGLVVGPLVQWRFPVVLSDQFASLHVEEACDFVEGSCSFGREFSHRFVTGATFSRPKGASAPSPSCPAAFRII